MYTWSKIFLFDVAMTITEQSVKVGRPKFGIYIGNRSDDVTDHVRVFLFKLGPFVGPLSDVRLSYFVGPSDLFVCWEHRFFFQIMVFSLPQHF